MADTDDTLTRTMLVIGVGNRDRGDDAAGPAVCDLLAELAPDVRSVVLEGNVLDLPTRWTAEDDVIIVDASVPHERPGTVCWVDAIAARLIAPMPVSTHTVDVSAAIELARAIGNLPRSLHVVGIEAAGDEHGAPLTPEVAASVDRVARYLASR